MPACSGGRSCGSGIGEVCRKDADNRRVADASRLDSATVGAREGVIVLLHLDAENLSRAVVHPKRAKLDCDAKLQVTTDGPLQVGLAGCHRSAIRLIRKRRLPWVAARWRR